MSRVKNYEDCSYLGEKLGVEVGCRQCSEMALGMEYNATFWNTLRIREIHSDLIHMIKIVF